MKKPIVLIIMDGHGENPDNYGNAIQTAKTPNLDSYYLKYPSTYIGASGMCVGLPDGQMGNSEVGHTNIGAGRIVYQELTRITKSIKDGDFFENEAIVSAIENCKSKNKALHLMGLLSDGGVHSHIEHLFGILEAAKKAELEKVYVHCFMDGRDVPPMSGKDFIIQLQKKMQELGVGSIATVSGRYYAMDRDNRWERVTLAYDAMVRSVGNFNPDPVDTMQQSYEKNVTDEFVLPTVCDKNGRISLGDSIIFFNFRPDRAREITRTFVDENFSDFPTEKLLPFFVCMTQYDAQMPNVYVAFSPQTLDNTLGEYISEKGLTQLRIAETEKYAHVTFFFNGGVEEPYLNEDRILVNSPKVSTYDLQPEMSAYEVCENVVTAVESGKYDVIILNYANCDMVGHTGIFEAAVKAVETVDTCVGKTVEAVLKMQGVVLITADHGNADKMYEDDGSPFTAHTTFPVPFIVVGAGNIDLRENGVLADISPTIIELLNKEGFGTEEVIEQPKEMTGKSLIVKN
ncbi:MAG: 2,3-bisphosphoglycerate-independent phosphoglycerate mutase [Oscillospiraceae bacterium]|jgi:2,3-bisphosphoglycerate-independent phosphoglycerate mutase|nr:2,3-bisphosphoglycerate-independent phosphoglycerate mutase [Oscillospiraceae bacterium]